MRFVCNSARGLCKGYDQPHPFAESATQHTSGKAINLHCCKVSSDRCSTGVIMYQPESQQRWHAFHKLATSGYSWQLARKAREVQSSSGRQGCVQAEIKVLSCHYKVRQKYEKAGPVPRLGSGNAGNRIRNRYSPNQLQIFLALSAESTSNILDTGGASSGCVHSRQKPLLKQ